MRFLFVAHTIDRRVDTILSVAEALRANEIERIRPWHFVDQDFSDAESRGVINWRGLR